MLTFKQIDALYWTATLGSFSNAAEKLHTTQSAITKRIKELEAYFQVEVFNRSSKKVQLTSKGEELYKLAQELIEKRDSMLNKLKGDVEYAGTIRLGVTEITSITWLPAFIHQLNEMFPKLTIIPRVGMGLELQRWLEKGQLDIAILSEVNKSRLLEYKPLGSLRMVWVGSPALVSDDKLYTPKELVNLPIIRQNEESSLNSVYDDWFSPYKSNQNIFTINGLFAMTGLAIANFGITCVPVDFVQPFIQAHKLVGIKVTQPAPAPVYSLAYAKKFKPMLLDDIYQVAKEKYDFSVSNWLFPKHF